MAAVLGFVHAGNTLKISFQSVGVTAHFEQEVPLTTLEYRFPEVIHLSLNDEFALDDNADAAADLLNLLQLVR